MHDTVGIAFQNLNSALEEDDSNSDTATNNDHQLDSDSENDEESLEVVPAKKMRRTFHCDSIILPEVPVNPKFIGTIQISE